MIFENRFGGKLVQIGVEQGYLGGRVLGERGIDKLFDRFEYLEKNNFLKFYVVVIMEEFVKF